MLPPFPNLPKGHTNFRKYKEVFDENYVKQPVHDFLGRHILFAQPDFNRGEDCAHTVYGKPRKNFYKEQFWKQERADRILWIKAALDGGGGYGTVTVLISHDAKDPRDDTRVYLLKTRDDKPDAKDEYYAVFAVVRNDNTLCFLTAYDVGETKALRWYKEYERETVDPKPKVPKAKKNKTPRVTFKTADETRNCVRPNGLVPEAPLWAHKAWFAAIYDLPVEKFSDSDLVKSCCEHKITRDYLGVVMPRCIERLETDPLIGHTKDGELLSAVMGVPSTFWSDNPTHLESVVAISETVFETGDGGDEIIEAAMNFCALYSK